VRLGVEGATSRSRPGRASRVLSTRPSGCRAARRRRRGHDASCLPSTPARRPTRGRIRRRRRGRGSSSSLHPRWRPAQET
jgi:hypothetical protein